MNFKLKASAAISVVVLLISVFFASQLFDTVKKGTYQVKQAAVTGGMSAKMTPGIWLKLFGDIDVWPKAETFLFTHDKDIKGDVDTDTSIEVRFNDGSLCRISGTARILMPTTENSAISLVTDRGHQTYADLEAKLLKPTIRSVLRHTANLMSATESYKERRGQFVSWARDQIENGLYVTETERKHITDLVSGEKVWKDVNVIKFVKGKPLYQKNALAGTGIEIKNFEVKSFRYAPKVKEQIAKQQQALMDVQTAKANAQKAEQDKLTIEAQGKARVAEAEYKEMEKKAVAIVQANRDKEMAIIEAEKKKEQAQIAKEEAIITAERKREVAALDAAAAAQEKKADILRGQGEAERKRLVMEADGALQLKADTWLAAQRIYAQEFGKQKWVSEIQLGAGSNGTAGDAVTQFMSLLSTKAARDLSLDLSMERSGQRRDRSVAKVK